MATCLKRRDPTTHDAVALLLLTSRTTRFCCSRSQVELHRANNRYIPENEVLNLMVQICMGLKHMHDRKILHRDLKSANVFLTKAGLVKLGDFGISRVLSNTLELASTAVGTPYYLSPEICENKKYNHKSDVWSVGVLLYELVALRVPFQGLPLTPTLHSRLLMPRTRSPGNSFAQLVVAIARGAYPPPPTHYSQELCDLIAMLLRHKPSERPSVNEVLRVSVVKMRIRSFFSREECLDPVCI